MVIMKIILPMLIIISLVACDQGIEPKPSSVPTGFSGKITFIGEWPIDIKRTHVVAFKDPLLLASDFNISNLKYVSEEIPNNTQTYVYSSLVTPVIPGSGYLAAGEYSYIAVALSKTPDLSLIRPDWFVAGLYVVPPDTLQPGKLIIPEGIVLENIDIICDFDNPPPQPPGGD